MKVKNRKIFITGGLGFIGSAIIQRLAPHNKIIIYDNGRRDALRYFSVKKHRNVKIVKGDILDVKLLKKSIKGCDTVVHLAAMAGVSSYYKNPVKTMEVNFLGTYNILNIAKDMNLKLFLNFSTSEVYGPYADKVKETHLTSQGHLQDSRWTYSVSKLAAEHLVFAFRRKHNLAVASVRPFNIYGPGQVGEGAIHIFIKNVLHNNPLIVTGDGTQVRAWCYVENLVNAVESILVNKLSIGEVFNIGDPGSTINILDLAKKIKKIAGSDSGITFKKHIGTDIHYRIPDIENAQKVLHFEPKIGLDEGLRLSIKWYKENLTGLERYEQ